MGVNHLNAKPNHPKMVKWVEEWAEKTQPEGIYWCNGSKEEYDELMQKMVDAKQAIKLNQDALPGCFLSAPTRPTSRAWKAAPSSPASRKTTRAPPTTGATPSN